MTRLSLQLMIGEKDIISTALPDSFVDRSAGDVALPAALCTHARLRAALASLASILHTSVDSLDSPMQEQRLQERKHPRRIEVHSRSVYNTCLHCMLQVNLIT
jgi:hypothetical protein